MKSLYLVDASAMFFRAYYAIRNLTSPSGMSVNAIYGYMSMTAKLLKDCKPDYIAYCYDPQGGSFRNDLDKNYKANRSVMPEDLAPQIPYMKTLIEHLGIFGIEKAGYEADDVIGTLAKKGRSLGLKVVIVSGDKDFGQLIEPNLTMLDTMRDIMYDHDKVVEKWGVTPAQFQDYLSIVGDTSDNIPGIKGIGQKGAATLLTEYGSLDGIYENLDGIKSKSIVTKLKEGREAAYHAKTLVEIKTDIDLKCEPEDLIRKESNDEELRAIFRELNFKTFEKTLIGARNTTGNETSDSGAKGSIDAAEAPLEETFQLSESYRAPKPISMGLEGLEKWLKPGDCVYAEAMGEALTLVKDDELVSLDIPAEELGPLLSRKNLDYEGFDLKTLWRKLGVTEPKPASWDSQLAAYVLLAGDRGSFSKVFKDHFSESIAKDANPELLYGAHQKLKLKLQEDLKRQDGQKVYETLELPLAPILLGMEQRGVRLNASLLHKESEALKEDIATIQKEIFEAAGEEFNVGSPKQLAQILFTKLELPPSKKTKTGFSTDNDVLLKLAPAYPIADMIVTYRELAKLKSTYVDALPSLVDPMTGRVHSCFNQALTTTGRLSSTNPNLQNIPIKTERGARVRGAFITDGGYSLISADYSQIELRILAHITGDPGLTRAFEQDLDIHQATAAEVFGLKLEDVTPDHRRKAKAVNFGIAYGQGVFGLAEALSISRSESKEIIERYFERFSKVRQFMNDTIESAKELGYVSTLFGRRRYLPELISKSPMQRKFGERAAVNAPIQGAAADIVKLAMIKVAQEVDLTLLLQVHDELILEGPSKACEQQLPQILKSMEEATQLNVPLKVNAAMGKNWGEAH